MKRRIIVLTAVALMGALLGGVARAGGAGEAATTIELHGTTTQVNFVDADPPGLGLGDSIAATDRLKGAGGNPAGHAGYVCTVTVVRSDHFQAQCLGTFRLSSGTITVQGLLTEPFREPHHPTTWLAVTGGTGSYLGATGSMTLHEVSENRTDYTFHLRSA